jgi:hypothetical protein
MSGPETKFIPFPETPVFPQRLTEGFPEDQVNKDPIFLGDPPLTGIPKSPEQSVFFKDRPPHCDYIYQKSEELNHVRTNGERRHIANTIANHLITNASKFSLVDIKASFTAIQEHEGGGLNTNASLIETDLFERALPEELKKYKRPISPQLATSLLEFSSNQDEEYGLLLLRSVIENADEEKKIVLFAQSICVAALESSSPEIESLAAKILLAETPALTIEDDQFINFISAGYSLDDETLGKFFRINHIVKFLYQINFPDNPMLGPLNDKFLTKKVIRKIAERKLIDEKRYLQITEFLSTSPGQYANDHLDEIEPGETMPFPHNLFVALDEMFIPYQARLVAHLIEGGDPSIFSGFEITSSDEPEVDLIDSEDDNLPRRVIQKIFETETGQVLPNSVRISALHHLAPENLKDLSGELTQTVGQIRDEIINDATITISPRGDLIKIDENSELGKIGIKHFLFRLGKERLQTRVTLLLHQAKINLNLNEYLNPIEFDSSKALTPETSSWWQLVILSHLRELLCRPQNIIVEVKNSNNEKDRTEAPDEFYSRRGHRRHLPEGCSFTREQQLIILRELNIDLDQYNKLRGKTTDTGMYTWVLPTAVRSSQKGPIVSTAPNAMETLASISSS